MDQERRLGPREVQRRLGLRHLLGAAAPGDDGTPGPGAYDGPGRISHSSASWSMHTSNRKIDVGSTGVQGGPGPGSHDPSSIKSHRSPAFTIAGKHKPPEALDLSPGPGAYFSTPPGEAHSTITRTGGEMLSVASKKWARSNPKSSTARRF